VDWLQQLGGILQEYTQGRQRSSTEDDFDNVVRTAPREEVSHGLAESFRSQETPPFPQMLAQLFGNSTGSQRASILNTLLATAGPALLSRFLAGRQELTPEQAEQVPAEVVQQVATEAEHRDPSVVDRISDFYADQPQLVKTLGAAALTVALAQLGRRHKLL
jgi:hypothetical protein